LVVALITDLIAGFHACNRVSSEMLLAIMASYVLIVAALYLGEVKWMIATGASLASSVLMALTSRGIPTLMFALTASALVKATSLLSVKRIIVRLRFNVKTVASLLHYLRENPQALFVVPFMALLVIAAGYLAMGYEEKANGLAEYAYYQLVAGVATALVLVVREERGRAAAASPSKTS